mmetsp:Transcript_112769/g.324107  ORF Transcript_112769/g.324107 Transcript_112769/m.324107 type:complete len:379 (+) Transcript_112769:2866-4002(+)
MHEALERGRGAHLVVQIPQVLGRCPAKSLPRPKQGRVVGLPLQESLRPERLRLLGLALAFRCLGVLVRGEGGADRGGHHETDVGRQHKQGVLEREASHRRLVHRHGDVLLVGGHMLGAGDMQGESSINLPRVVAGDLLGAGRQEPTRVRIGIERLGQDRLALLADAVEDLAEEGGHAAADEERRAQQVDQGDEALLAADVGDRLPPPNLHGTLAEVTGEDLVAPSANVHDPLGVNAKAQDIDVRRRARVANAPFRSEVDADAEVESRRPGPGHSLDHAVEQLEGAVAADGISQAALGMVANRPPRHQDEDSHEADAWPRQEPIGLLKAILGPHAGGALQHLVLHRVEAQHLHPRRDALVAPLAAFALVRGHSQQFVQR